MTSSLDPHARPPAWPSPPVPYLSRRVEEWIVEHFHADAGQLVDDLIEWPLDVVRVTPLLRDARTMRNTIWKLAKAPGMDVPVIAPR